MTDIDTSTCGGGHTSTPIDVTYGDYEITLIAAEPPRPTPGSTRDDSRDEKLADDSIKPVTWDLDLIGAGIGASLKAGLLIVGKVSEKVAAKSLAGVGGKVLRGSQNPKVAEAAAKGREMHAKKDYGSGFEKEFRLGSGKRADAINRDTKEVIELKPNNPQAIARGEKQVEAYRQELETMFGGTWTSKVETY
jgi:Restriction endonuclease fold toxin 9